MKILHSHGPIIACSSGSTSNAAIALIRISGFENLDFLEKSADLKADKIKPRHAHYCSLFAGKEKLDDIVLTFFPAPNSYNGENILELGVHGNLINIERIIGHFIQQHGFKRAAPGEFTYRALRNNKLSLFEVEGLDLLLNANSHFALDQGQSLLSGSLKASYKSLYEAFLKHKSAVELCIDFSDDIGDEAAQKSLTESYQQFLSVAESLYERSKANVANINRPDVCLVGPPNSGKSALFNSLLKSERSIVSGEKGTTRDFVSMELAINGIVFNLIDTAGIHEAENLVEKEGIRRSLHILENSFFKIALINPTDADRPALPDYDYDLIVFTHADLTGDAGPIGASDAGPIGASEGGPIGASDGGPIGASDSGPMGASDAGPIGADNAGPIGADYTASSRSVHLNALKPEPKAVSKILNAITDKFALLLRTEPIMIDRHREILVELFELTRSYGDLLEMGDLALTSAELNNIGHCIDELIGIVSPETVLRNIFENFCIGK